MKDKTNIDRVKEIQDEYEHLVWRTDKEAELLQIIGELVDISKDYDEYVQHLEHDIQLMDRNFRKWTGSSNYGYK